MKQMSYDLEGKWVLVTGASGGIGAYFAELFCNHGCNVVITARRHAKLVELAEKLSASTDKKILPLEVDMSSQDSIDALMVKLQENNVVVDVLINNAGIAESDMFADTPFEDMRRVMATNFEGAWYLSQAVSKALKAAEKGGSIINIASILGFDVTQFTSVYAASKAAMIQSSKVQALELARYGIRVNNIAPGYIRTPLNDGFFSSAAGEKMIKRIPQRQLGQFEDLAGAALLLASPLSRYMTGSTITVDGGHLCRTL